MKILLAGATGFIGKSLVHSLGEAGHHVTALTRSKTKNNLPCVSIVWDASSVGTWSKAVEDSDAVINLAGENIARRRWTRRQKKRILESRLQTIQALFDAMDRARQKPKIFIQASAIGYYGPSTDQVFTEDNGPGTDFLSFVCQSVEHELVQAKDWDLRCVALRIGVVLEKGGGALPKIGFPFRLFMGGHLGNGSQWFSWIHRQDLIGIIHHVLENPSIHGAVNATAPEPVTLKEFCRTLGEVLHRPSWAHVPGFVLKILLGEMSEMVLCGQRVLPQKLLDIQYPFRYPHCRDALTAILRPSSS